MPVRKFFNNTFGPILNDALFGLKKKQSFLNHCLHSSEPAQTAFSLTVPLKQPFGSNPEFTHMADWIHFKNETSAELTGPPIALPEEGFLWLDCTLDEDLTWIPTAEQLLGIKIDELHHEDLSNILHPSHYDSSGNEYSLLIIRSLSNKPLFDDAHQLNIRTRPTFFLITNKLLVTYRSQNSKTFDLARQFVKTHTTPGISSSTPQTPVNTQFLKFKKTPESTDELLIQLVRGLVHRFLETRVEISEQIERWQRDLLNPKRRFQDWNALLDARNELARLETVAQDQTDALEDWLDYKQIKKKSNHALQVKAHDTLEHLERIIGFARRLGASTEAALQLHFSATAHKTNELISVLTLLSAFFMPLTLITGLFGMNFKEIPLINNPHGFWISMGLMALTSVILVLGILHIKNKKLQRK